MVVLGQRRQARHLFVILGEYLAAHAHAHARLILNDALLGSLIDDYSEFDLGALLKPNIPEYVDLRPSMVGGRHAQRRARN